jgi:hypothetical protein
MKKIGIALAASLAVAAFIWIGGQVVMHLWNWNLPAIFGWKAITFWQAIGLFALCRILFGDLGMRVRGPHRPYLWRRVSGRWERLTPEERDALRRKWASRCGGFDMDTPGPASGESKEPA